jgi:uncharacterized protein YkwD
MGTRLSPGALAALLAAAALLVAALGAGLLLTQPAQAASCKNANAGPREVGTTAYEKAVECLINKERVARSKDRLQHSDQLAESAQRHTVTMQNKSCFKHQCPGEPALKQRVRATGYLNGATKFALGENIGWGKGAGSTPRSMVEAWMDSPPHRGAILNKQFEDFGVGVRFGTPFNPAANGATFTVNFGFRRP